MDPTPLSSAGPAVELADDVELLVRIADRDRSPEDAEAAFVIFYQRHAGFLERACEKYGYSHPTLAAADVVSRVMVAVFSGKATFSPPSGNEDLVRRSIRAWLIRVARNQFHAEIRRLRFDDNVVPLGSGSDDVVTPPIFPDDDVGLPPQQRNKILQFRYSLSTLDRVILDRSLPYFDRKSETFNVPPSVAKSIAAEVDRTVPAVRKRRERMMAALEAFCASDTD